MSHLNRRDLIAALGLGAIAPWAAGQAYPHKPIKLIVPYPAGAAVDRIGRSLANELTKRLGQSVVVENVGGASGTLGAKRVMREPADGYVLLMGTVNDLVVAPTVFKAGYSTRDFTPIAKVSVNSTVLVAHPSFPANHIDELVALARKSDKPMLIGSAGAAVMQTVGGTLLAEAAQIKFTPVVYKGGAPLVTDLLAGQVQFATISLPSVLPLIREGKLKALGLISSRRDPSAPHIPTVNEGKSVKGVEADLWTGLVGPADLPAAVTARLAAAMKEILADAAYRETEFKAGSIIVDYADPAAFRQYLATEQTRLQPVLAQIKAE